MSKTITTEVEINDKKYTFEIRKRAIVDFAKWMTEGVMLFIGMLVLLAYGLRLVLNLAGIGVDDSDLNGLHRSGLQLHTDYKTGVQYLSNGRMLIPRVDRNGEVINIYSAPGESFQQ